MLHLLGAALAAPTLHGTLGSERFWHEHDVTDAHVVDADTLLTLAGCTVHRWKADGTLVSKTPLKGCTPGLNRGFFSADGEWVVASGLWVGEAGVWRVTGGERVHEVEDITFTQACGGGLWWVDGSKGFARLDFETGRVKHPADDHGTAFLCIDDRWLLDEHGHRVDFDGTVTELDRVGSTTVAGTTGTGSALVRRYEQWIDEVAQDGTVTRRFPCVETPERVVPWRDGLLELEDGEDRVWHIGPDGHVVDGPWFSENVGLGSRRGHGALFVWNDQPWGWAGHRAFRLDQALPPLDTLYEQWFFDADDLWICHGPLCEARRLADLQGPVRTIVLPEALSSDTQLSSANRFLAQYDTRRVYRVELDTGAIHASPIPEWPDGISVDATGRIRWRLSEDPDEDEVYDTRVFTHGDDGGVVELDHWQERDLADPGWAALRVAPPIRWADGTTLQSPEAENWFETADGRVVLALGWGRSVEVWTPAGRVARMEDSIDTFGPWGEGVWVGQGQIVRFLDRDLAEKSRLTIPWPLGDFTVEGVGSPDGAWFAARQPGGRIAVWSVGPAATLSPETPVAMSPWEPEVKKGDLLAAPTWSIPEVPLLGLDPEEGYLTDDAIVLLALATPEPATAEERLIRIAGVDRTRVSDEEVWDLRHRWLARAGGHGVYDDDAEIVPVDAKKLDADIASAFRRAKLARVQKEIGVSPARSGPAFGLDSCHRLEDEPGTTPPRPPVAPEVDRPVAPGDRALVVRVAEDGTPSWVATLEGTRGDLARACWKPRSGAWTPARRGDAAVPMCVLLQCTPAPPPEE